MRERTFAECRPYAVLVLHVDVESSRRAARRTQEPQYPDHSVQRCTVTPTPSSALCGAENAASARPQLAQQSETCQCSGAGELSGAPYHAEILYRPYTVCERGKCRCVGTAYAELDGEGLDVPSQARGARADGCLRTQGKSARRNVFSRTGATPCALHVKLHALSASLSSCRKSITVLTNSGEVL